MHDRLRVGGWCVLPQVQRARLLLVGPPPTAAHWQCPTLDPDQVAAAAFENHVAFGQAVASLHRMQTHLPPHVSRGPFVSVSRRFPPIAVFSASLYHKRRVSLDYPILEPLIHTPFPTQPCIATEETCRYPRARYPSRDSSIPRKAPRFRLGAASPRSPRRKRLLVPQPQASYTTLKLEVVNLQVGAATGHEGFTIAL